MLLAVGMGLTIGAMGAHQATAQTPSASKPTATAPSLAQRTDYQAALRAASEGLFEVAAVKFERLRQSKDLPAKDAATVTLRLIDSQIRARQGEAALAAIERYKIDDAAYWRAQAYVVQRKYREAEAHIKAYLQIKGSKYEDLAKLTLGQVVIAQSRENAGRQPLKDTIDSSHPAVAAQAWLLWNESEIIAGRAPVVLRRLGTSTNDPKAEFLKACCHLALGNGKAAEILLRRIVDPKAKQPKWLHDISLIRLAEAYALQGRGTADKVLLIFLDTDVPTLYYEQAFAALDDLHATTNDKEDITRNLTKWSADPTIPERQALALYFLAKEYRQEGKIAEAAELLEKFRVSFPSHAMSDEVLRVLMSLHGELRQDERVLELANVWRKRYGTGGEDIVDFLTGMTRFTRGEHADAAALFRRSASLATDVLQKQRATYNAAVAAILANRPKLYEQCLAELQTPSPVVVETSGKSPAVPPDHASELQLERALHLAETNQAGAEAALQEFIKNHPDHARATQAIIAQAEINLLDLPPRPKAAEAGLEAVAKLPNISEATHEQIDYIRVWLKVAEDDWVGVTEAAAKFLTKWPKSARADEVEMKSAQAYYQIEDYAKALAQFESLAEQRPNSPYAESALFLAGKAAINLLTTEGVEKALTLWADVVARNGPLATEARRYQALAKRRKGEETEALAVIKSLLAATPPPTGNDRLSLLVEKGELHVLLSRLDPLQLEEAIQVFASVTQDGSASRLWRSRAGLLLAQSYRQTEKISEALEASTDVVDSCLASAADTPLTPSEFQWYYRAGFLALDLLEMRQEWEAAARFAERLSTGGGERAAEAQERAKKLRLEHFLWDK